MNKLSILFMVCGDKDEDTVATEPTGELSGEVIPNPLLKHLQNHHRPLHSVIYMHRSVENGQLM